MKWPLFLLTLALTFSPSLSPHLLARESPQGAESTAQKLRTEIDDTVRAYLASRRPAPPAAASDDTYIQEIINREIQVSTSGGDQKPQTVVQFLKKKKSANKGKDRAAQLQAAMASANAQTQRELAIVLLTEMKMNAFKQVKQDLLWRSAVDEESPAASLNLLEPPAMTQLIADYWWAQTRLDALQ